VNDWKPTSGQVALIELADSGDDCLTGIVVDGDGTLIIDLGASARPLGDKCDATVSIFDPDALYRIDATLVPHDGTRSIVDIDVHDIERIQRRITPRARIVLPVALTNLDEPDPASGVFVSVTGETIDVSEGGCRVIIDRRFPNGCDPTVTLHVSDSETLVALAAILEEVSRSDGRFEYRLVFLEPDDGHRELLGKLVAAA
jgi:hypothetical protein